MIPLAAFEEIIDASGVAARIEAMLPAGVRPRQLRVRTLLAGMCLAQADHRPAHLTRVHQALASLPEDDQPDGLPSGLLQDICDGLLEASVPGQFKPASTSLAVDRTDLESFSRPP